MAFQMFLMKIRRGGIEEGPYIMSVSAAMKEADQQWRSLSDVEKSDWKLKAKAFRKSEEFIKQKYLAMVRPHIPKTTSSQQLMDAYVASRHCWYSTLPVKDVTTTDLQRLLNRRLVDRSIIVEMLENCQGSRLSANFHLFAVSKLDETMENSPLEMAVVTFSLLHGIDFSQSNSRYFGSEEAVHQLIEKNQKFNELNFHTDPSQAAHELYSFVKVKDVPRLFCLANDYFSHQHALSQLVIRQPGN